MLTVSGRDGVRGLREFPTVGRALAHRVVAKVATVIVAHHEKNDCSMVKLNNRM